MPSVVTDEGEEFIRNNGGQRRLFALTGKPGCGKSFVASKFRDDYGYPVVEMGEEMKNLYIEYPLADNTKAHELPGSTWAMAQHMRETHGQKGPAVASTSKLAAAFGESDCVVLDGVRNIAEVEYIKDVFECFVHLISVEVDYNTRVERFADRHKDTEEYYEYDIAHILSERKMNTRTQRETAEGLQDAIDYANYKIDNSGTGEETEMQIARLLDDIEPL